MESLFRSCRTAVFPVLVLVLLVPAWSKEDKKEAPPPNPRLSGSLTVTVKPWTSPEDFPFVPEGEVRADWDLPEGLRARIEATAGPSGFGVKTLEGRWKLHPWFRVAAGWGSADTIPTDWGTSSVSRLGQSRLEDWMVDQGYGSPGRYLVISGDGTGTGWPLGYEAVLAFDDSQYTPRYQGRLWAVPLPGLVTVGLGADAEPRVLGDGAGALSLRESAYGSAWALTTLGDLRFGVTGVAGLDRPKAPKNPGDVPAAVHGFTGCQAGVEVETGPLVWGAGGSLVLWEKPPVRRRDDGYLQIRFVPVKGFGITGLVGLQEEVEGGVGTLSATGRAEFRWQL